MLETAKDGQKIEEDPWMIPGSAMEIFPAKKDDQFVRFKIYYRPYEQLVEKLSEIDGIIVAIKEVLYFIGLERPDTRSSS